jgi:hypothetical protein
MNKPVIDVKTLPKEKKDWLAHAICGMVCADGKVDEIETELLKKALGFLDNKEAVMALIQKVEKRTIPKLSQLRDVPRGEAFRIYLFLGRMALTDSRVTSEEIEHLTYIGGKLGFPNAIGSRMNKIIMEGRNLLKEEQEIKDRKLHWDKKIESLEKDAVCSDISYF